MWSHCQEHRGKSIAYLSALISNLWLSEVRKRLGGAVVVCAFSPLGFVETWDFVLPLAWLCYPLPSFINPQPGVTWRIWCLPDGNSRTKRIGFNNVCLKVLQVFFYFWLLKHNCHPLTIINGIRASHSKSTLGSMRECQTGLLLHEKYQILQHLSSCFLSGF